MDKNKIRRRVRTPSSDRKTTDPLLAQVYSHGQYEEVGCCEKIFLTRGKIKWYFSPLFIGFWILLYYAMAIPAFHWLPEPLNIKDEAKFPDRFIAERAEIYLQKLVSLGPRVVGSKSNEQASISLFTNTMKKFRSERGSMMDIEMDVQTASGSYIHWEMINMYQSIQNVVIKLSPKESNSTSYLLVNSHFDSVPGGPGAGDDGAMVAVMLETLRVLLKSNKPLRHPVVFLFNGAEENPLQASHAFITQHKWAKNCKALINLDSAGNGGKEILFQSGPNHPWLMRHYHKAIVHPFASTVAEEMFQHHFIPSDTDFRIFRDHGKVPGLDMAHQYNGYVYHTRYDRAEILPRASLQNTGDNVLALVQELANAPELDNTDQYAEGHTVFFDVLGSFLVFYSERDGIILNVLTSVAAIICCFISFKMMANNAGVKMFKILEKSLYTFGVQIVAVVAASVLCFSMGVFMDLVNLPMSWFTHSWLILGLYFCPLFFGFAIVPALYFLYTKDHRFPAGHRVQMLLHCHCLFLALVTLVLTINKIRSSFMFMIAILFYTLALIINLATKLHNKEVPWLIPHIICGIPPFLFYAYLSHGFFVAFIPMTGRFGSSTNPDLIICAFTVGVGLLTGGFMIPVLNLFRKSKTIICSLLIFTVISIIIAATPLGFPYRPETNIQRFSVLHTQRHFRDANNEIRRSDSGYYILPQDRRTYSVKNHVLNYTLAQSIMPDCKTEMLCGVPHYNHRWHKARESSLWIPASPPHFTNQPNLKVTLKKPLSTSSIRYEFELKGPDHMAIFLGPLNESRVTAWSFHQIPLRMGWEAPYFIYFSYGIDDTPLKFWIELEVPSGDFKNPIIEIGVSGHWNHQDELLTEDFKMFLNSFPKYVDSAAWPSSYDTWLF